jgi:hypothetical protein
MMPRPSVLTTAQGRSRPGGAGSEGTPKAALTARDLTGGDHWRRPRHWRGLRASGLGQRGDYFSTVLGRKCSLRENGRASEPLGTAVLSRGMHGYRSLERGRVDRPSERDDHCVGPSRTVAGVAGQTIEDRLLATSSRSAPAKRTCSEDQQVESQKNFDDQQDPSFRCPLKAFSACQGPGHRAESPSAEG